VGIVKKEAKMSKSCFVIMPFSQTTGKHTEKYWTDFFEKFIKPSIENFGYSCRRSQAQPSNIIKDILTDLSNADLVIAVLTDYNANVWYELGIRHAQKKGTIMIIEKGEKIPFDISQYGVITYMDTIAGAKDFENEIKRFIDKIENSQSADSPVLEFQGSVTENDYHQMVQDLKVKYNTKLEKITELLQNIQKDITGREKKEKEPYSKNRVLWVDDYPSNNEVIIDLYRAQGIEFDLAINTDQALEFLEKNQYDLIISDIGRGSVKDAGIRMLREINRHFGKIPPVIFFSSSKTVEKFWGKAKKERALLATSDIWELINKIAEVLEK
jgi:CheY-like chemotaxis protein